MADIEIQRGEVDVPDTGTTVAPGTSFAALTSAFVLLSNNRNQSAGSTISVANMDGDGICAAADLTATNQITFDRVLGTFATNTRCAWESWEYTGAVGGPNEFIVRGRVQLSLTGTTASTTISGIVDIDRCVPFVTGILMDFSPDGADASTAVAQMSGINTLTVNRGGTHGTTTVYVTVVEFTGSNWTLRHGFDAPGGGDSGTVELHVEADGQTGIDTIDGVPDWGNAFIIGQYRANNAENVDIAVADHWPTFVPGVGTTTVDWQFDADHDDSTGDQEIQVHVIYNPRMSVTRFADTTRPLIGDNAVDITAAGLTDLTTAAVLNSYAMNGTSTLYGNGWINVRISTLTEAIRWVHKDAPAGGNYDNRIEIIDLSGLDTQVDIDSVSAVSAQSLRDAEASADIVSVSTVEASAETNPVTTIASVSTIETASTADFLASAVIISSSVVRAGRRVEDAFFEEFEFEFFNTIEVRN